MDAQKDVKIIPGSSTMNLSAHSSSKLFSLIEKEHVRQEKNINLIASENYASPNIMRATGSQLTNKYAEGYPGKRYYGGCEVVDEIESYGNELARSIYQAAHANLQPHSGSQANMAVYFSQLKPQDTVLGMSLIAGGHLTHGHKINFSGTLYNFVGYNVSPEDEQIDYDEISLLADQHKPKLIIAGASAYSRFIDFARIALIARDHGALFMADMAHISGLVATGLHPNPVPVADFVTSTTHKTLRGPRGGMILCKADFAQAIDKAVMPGLQGGPLMHVIAAKAMALEEARSPEFKTYQLQVLANAQAMCETFASLGHHLVAGGTDNHLFLLNLTECTHERIAALSGKEAEETLQKAHITVNRNCVPRETKSPLITSGLRMGTPAITSRGMKENDARQIAHWIHEALTRHDDAAFLQKLQDKVSAFCSLFPIY